MTERFAVYFAPAPDTPLWDFGTSWLGRDPERDIDLPRPDLPGLEDGDIARISASPRRYGFHGTLKPPFGLADGQDAEALYAAVAAFAASRLCAAHTTLCSTLRASAYRPTRPLTS